METSVFPFDSAQNPLPSISSNSSATAVSKCKKLINKQMIKEIFNYPNVHYRIVLYHTSGACVHRVIVVASVTTWGAPCLVQVTKWIVYSDKEASTVLSCFALLVTFFYWIFTISITSKLQWWMLITSSVPSLLTLNWFWIWYFNRYTLT